MKEAVVMLDPGHGGRDPGAVANGLLEKDLNLRLAFEVAARLEGLEVVLTREDDSYLSLADRVAFSKRIDPDFFLSLHANAGGGRGFESFVSSGLPGTDRARRMQDLLHKRIMSALQNWPVKDRGKKEAAFYVLRYNESPAVLIESLFIDNAAEAALWLRPDFVADLADGVAQGIEAALFGESIEKKHPYHRVQVGAFTEVENARRCLERARAAGFSDAFIKSVR